MVVERAFEVLHETEARDPNWRPMRPITVTQPGLVLLAQSVEVANSILRVCHLLDIEQSGRWFASTLDLLKKYTDWLESRLIRGEALTTGGRRVPFLGWQSEHTHEHRRIHLWATSQILLF